MTWFESGPLKVLTASVDEKWQCIVSPPDYSRLLCALHAQQDVIPMRYGSLLADGAALERWLQENTRAFVSQLEQLRGMVEMTVLLPDQGITAPEEIAAEEKTGTGQGAAYLRARRDKYVRFRNEKALLPLKAEVDGLYRDCRVEPVSYMDQPLVRIHLLVPRALIKTFQQRLSLLLECHPDWTSSGPFPPSSFL